MGKQWNKELIVKVHNYGFKQFSFDYCLFIKQAKDDFIVLIVYVDDMLITSLNEQPIQYVKHFLHQQFTIRDLGYAKIFLAMEIS